MQDHIQSLLQYIGENPEREGLKDTPRRVEQSYKELFSGYTGDLKSLITTFDSEGYDEMIVCKNIEFYSMCEHHMLPFFGTVSVAYIPDKKIIGLSKIPRMVEMFARRLQNQERLAMNIADTMMEFLSPKGVGVIITAQHFCMMARGVKKQQAEMTTSTLRGLFKTNHSTRAEFMTLVS